VVCEAVESDQAPNRRCNKEPDDYVR